MLKRPLWMLKSEYHEVSVKEKAININSVYFWIMLRKQSIFYGQLKEDKTGAS